MSRYVRIRNLTRGTVVVEHCRVASNLPDRTVGLLGKREVGPGEGLLLERTSSIHMFFMRFPIDVVFVDRAGEVTRTISRLGRWRIAFAPRGTRDCVELRAGGLDGTQTMAGDQLAFEPID